MSTPLEQLMQAFMDPPAEIPGAPAGGMTEQDVAAIVEQEIAAALQVTEGSDLALNRRDARDYYNRRPVGLMAPVPNRSQAITSDVRDTVNWAMPGIMRVFFAGSQFLRFEETTPDGAAAAKVASRGINKLFLDEAGGFMCVYTAVKNALIEKNGPIRVYTEVKREVCYEKYQELTQDQVQELLESKPGAQIMRSEQAGSVPLLVQGQVQQLDFWNIEIRIPKETVRLRVRAIAPENFLASPRCDSIDDDTPFAGERYLITRSDLVAMGIDAAVVAELPAVSDDGEIETVRTERYQDESPGLSDNYRTDQMAKVWVTDCYVRIDEDGDGIAELRHIICAGQTGVKILLDEYAPYQQFLDLCAWPMPHTIHGESVFDLVGDLQLYTSTLMRNELDNIYVLNNGRWQVVEGLVNIDDLLDNKPGGVVRVQEKDAVTPLDTQALGGAPANMRAELAGLREQRTGMSRVSQGMDASALRNTTATAVQGVMSAAQQIQELVCRVFAEGPLKRLGLLLLREVCNGPHKKRLMKVDQEWVQFDPAKFDPEMSCSVVVGLGVGQAQERIANLSALQADQKMAYDLGWGGWMVTPQNAMALIDEKVSAMGFRTNPFFTAPVGDPPPPPPNPGLIAAQAAEVEAKSKSDKVKADVAVDAARIQTDKQKTVAETQLKVGELALKQRELDIRLEVDMARLASQQRIELARLNADREVRIAQARAQEAQAQQATRNQGAGAA